MHRPLEHIFVGISQNIPEEILDLAFRKYENIPSQLNLSLHDLIRQKVIRGRMLRDCNIVGGKIKQIVLSQDYLEDITYGYAESSLMIGKYCLYRIPTEEREGVALAEVNGITYPSNLGGSHLNIAGYGGGATLPIVANGVLDAQTYQSSTSRPTPELLSGDLVRLNPPQYNHIDWVLSCRLCYDDSFSNINQAAIIPLTRWAICAVKAYIYNYLVIKLDRGAVEFGSELGRVKEVIDKYSEEDVRYWELLDKFAGGATLDMRRLETYFNFAL